MGDDGNFLEIEPGTVVANRYRINRPLGRGGMGEVFHAENIRTGRPVAVKLLRADAKTKSSSVARFRREARAAGSINSDHVTQVLDVEEDAEHGIVIVFELLEGESLIDRLKRTGPVGFDELHPIIEQVWLGLADAHRAGIIHRDLKPSNVFLERRPDGITRVKILDFGISKLPKEMGGETLTEMGQSLGTFSFMPPEQIGKAKTVDHRADIYACATLIYQALSGQLPYTARNILVMVEMKTKTDARKLAEAMGVAVEPRLEAFLQKGLLRDANQRFQTAIEALNAWRELRPGGMSSSGSGSHSGHPTPPPGSAGSPSQVSQSANVPGAPRAVSIAGKPPDASDSSSSSSAATLAMPMSQYGLQPPQSMQPQSLSHMQQQQPQSLQRPPQQHPQHMGQQQPNHLGRTSPMSAQLAQASQVGLGGTLLVKPDGGPAHRPNPLNAARVAEASRELQSASMLQQPSGYYPVPSQQQPQSSMQVAQARAMVPRIIDESTSAPGSADQTRVYRPDGRNPPSMLDSSASPSQSMNVSVGNVPQQAPEKRSGLALALGALAFAVVGFLIVAALLEYWKTH
ncbi:MAG TPA: serine/threonine-protein kinase [Byssovorax sp.]|jgi:serine/threonine-protein kinase